MQLLEKFPNIQNIEMIIKMRIISKFTHLSDYYYIRYLECKISLSHHYLLAIGPEIL